MQAKGGTAQIPRGDSEQKEKIQTPIVGRQEPCMPLAVPFHASAIPDFDLASKARKKVSLDSLGGAANFATGSDLGRKGQWPISSSATHRRGSLMGFSFTAHCNAESLRDSQKVERRSHVIETKKTGRAEALPVSLIKK